MDNLNHQIKEQAAPGVLKVIEWALVVHEDTMKVLANVDHHLAVPVGKFTLAEREEARKILLDYGAGKPTRIVEHRGNKKQPIAFGKKTDGVRRPVVKSIISHGTIDVF